MDLPWDIRLSEAITAHATVTREPAPHPDQDPAELIRWPDGQLRRQTRQGPGYRLRHLELETSRDGRLTFHRHTFGIYLWYVIRGSLHGPEEAKGGLDLTPGRLLTWYAPAGESPVRYGAGNLEWVVLHLDEPALRAGYGQIPAFRPALLAYALGSLHSHLRPASVQSPAPDGWERILRPPDPPPLTRILEALGIRQEAPEKEPDVANRVQEALRTQVRTSPLPTIQELADALGLHPDTLARKFQQAYGIPLKQYLLHLKMEEAWRLLTEEQRTVRAVSQRLGYSHPAGFSARFRRYFGLSPQAVKADHGPPPPER
ncbi:hypothetical protein GCM10027275_10610 [Rhabdobacter roseus]|uniref:AraC-like DNA-binding protein n=1 Tax=Rhabdobacter roseus TaxID=1655419 RepID=A0A840TSJ1_9BACT|nr:helix-turn-helix transcriptional regulator [Rhabdobacter roseus]MBB5282970.1 AraC-like DNA-binding protein [Rhabdobacter roseus]